MNTAVKLGGFVAILAVVLAASFGIGRLVGPIGAVGAPTNDVQPTEVHTTPQTQHGEGK